MSLTVYLLIQYDYFCKYKYIVKFFNDHCDGERQSLSTETIVTNNKRNKMERVFKTQSKYTINVKL